MHEFMRVRNYSERTQKTYLGAVAKFAAFFHTPPDKLGPPEILMYQLHLRDHRHVSFSFFNQVMSALRLFYGQVLEREEMLERIPFMHRERHLPVVLSPEEILRLIDSRWTSASRTASSRSKRRSHDAIGFTPTLHATDSRLSRNFHSYASFRSLPISGGPIANRRCRR
jgi:site-specific recombinase XerD